MSSPPAGAARDETVATQAARRRTFAIIAPPHAGKTTLIEKLLLYSDRIAPAGSVDAPLSR